MGTGYRFLLGQLFFSNRRHESSRSAGERGAGSVDAARLRRKGRETRRIPHPKETAGGNRSETVTGRR